MNRHSAFGGLGLALGLLLLLPRPAWAQATAPAQKQPWVHSADIPWANPGTLGPGTSTKMLLTRENGFLDDLIRAEYLLKVDAGGSYAANDTAKEDLAFYVTAGQARFTLADQQIDAKPGDAFGVPAGTRHAIANNGQAPFEAVVFAAPLQAPNPTAKPVWGRGDDLKWAPNATHGPGCDLKMILNGGFSTVIRGLWTIRVNGLGLSYVHTSAEHTLYYFYDAPEPIKNARDGRTEAGRLILGDTAVQLRLGDAFYAAGAPLLADHGMYNESKDKPLAYVAIGVRQPGTTTGRGAPAATGPSTPPAKP